MLNTVYQLKRPRQFEVVFKEIEPDDSHILVRPTHLSICHADQRYYQGSRPDEVLRRKLPMALIHEGIGTVIYDPSGRFQMGEQVVMIPNLPMEEDPVIAENYLQSSGFCASGTDGFLQEYVRTTADRIIRLPERVNPVVAAFTELVSVSYHALQRFLCTAHMRRAEIAVWGDGNLGYITALLLHYLCPQTKLYVVGVHEEKLSYFTFADEIRTTSQLNEDFVFDHALECVGGQAANSAINQMIAHIRPEGTIGLLGVSEEPVPLDTRMILEKGLRLIGSSRSGRSDFEGLMKLYRMHPHILSYLENIVGEQFVVRDIKDIRNAFEADIHKLMGKTVMIWDE
ncbi:Ribulose-5-phosphate reductase 1 [Eubacterium plexicaudatum ASF492]|uniref:Ribulose-5-phosphate reductase n=1 Tax=Eubacterium plexicaudatum ASF492 TaxID=1235802 RepID=N2ANE3_9FIRM|nr:Ribulose-5-phosphate reductase 1 [Eubacterium plexicaudatum ASF492]